MLITKVKSYAFDKMHRDLESLEFSNRMISLSLLDDYYAPQAYFNENKSDFLFDAKAFIRNYLINLKEYTAELIAHYSTAFSERKFLVYSLMFPEDFHNLIGAFSLAYIQEINLKIEDYLNKMHKILILNAPTEPEIEH